MPCPPGVGHAPSLVPLHGLGGAKDLPIPLRAGRRRRHGRPRRLLLRAGPGLAHAALPGRPARGGPAPAWLARLVDRPALRVGRAGPRAAVLRLPASGPWSGDRTWSPTRCWAPSTCSSGSGWCRCRSCSGPWSRAVSPVRTLNLLLARLTGGDAGVGPGHLPRPARLLAGRRRACSPSSGRSWSTRRAPTSARCGSGWRRTSP